VLCHPNLRSSELAICAAVSNESMTEQLLALQLSACGPLAGLADEAHYIVAHIALNPLGDRIFLLRPRL
jgi:hypothetical protein